MNIDSTLERSPVANLAAESALLSAMMQVNNKIDDVADIVSESDFFDPTLGEIFSVLVREHNLGRSANPVTIRPYFDGHPGLADYGGVSYLAELTASPVSMLGIRDFALQVRELSERRAMIFALTEALDRAHDLNASNTEIAALADAAVSDKSDEAGVVEKSASACMDEVLEIIGKQEQGVRSTVIPTMDRLLGDLRPKQLVILAGRPGMGKTATALSYALGAAQGGHGVLFASLEMSGFELAARMAADMCFDGDRGVAYSTIRDGTANLDIARKLKRAKDELQDIPFQIIDAARLTVSSLNRRVKRWKRRMAARGEKLELVMVDYLQLMSPDGKGKSHYEVVSEVSRGLKAIAKEHDVAVVALAQLSREVEKRPDKRPQLSDLRDSGQIEQDADAVMFLVRDEYYLRQSEPDAGSIEYIKWESTLREAAGKIDFICAKVRHGVTGVGTGQFHGAYQAVRG